MISAVAMAVDESLLDPANDGVADVEPAAVTYGATSIAAGSDPLADMKSLIEAFDGDLLTATFVMQPATAASLAGTNFPSLGVNGGDIWGIPVATSRKAPASTIILIDGDGLAEAEGDIEIDWSSQASLELADDPTMTADSPTETTVVSLWQTNSVAFKTILAVNWKSVRTGSVSMLTGVAYRPFLT